MHGKSRSWIPNYFKPKRDHHSLSESCELCVMHLLYWVQQKMFLLINQNWLREMLLKKLVHIWLDVVNSLVKTIDGQKFVISAIVNVFFNNKRKISTASVRKDNVASFKKQKRETIFLWYSLIIILLY